MSFSRHIRIPTLVRIKPGALGRIGLYLARPGFTEVTVIASEGLPLAITESFQRSLAEAGIRVLQSLTAGCASLEAAQTLLGSLSPRAAAVLGLGGGRALDVAKQVSHLAGVPFVAVPTSLSNDGFCSPQSSLTVAGARRSLPCSMPYGVVIDTAVTQAAPRALWWSGIGDLVSKVTAVRDWKLAFRACGTPVDDFAALLSDATVRQFLARPEHDVEGDRLLGTALMLNGVAMEVCGSSRPASGSEHLISHALDEAAREPRLHGLQVGVAAYIVSHLQAGDQELIAALFDRTRFWDAFRDQQLSRAEWLAAVRRAPAIKQNFHTVLSERNCLPEVERLLEEEPRLRAVFAD